jgi:hypothetical protein
MGLGMVAQNVGSGLCVGLIQMVAVKFHIGHFGLS